MTIYRTLLAGFQETGREPAVEVYTRQGTIQQKQETNVDDQQGPESISA